MHAVSHYRVSQLLSTVQNVVWPCRNVPWPGTAIVVVFSIRDEIVNGSFERLSRSLPKSV